MRENKLYEKAVDSINKTEWYRDEKFLSKLPKRGFNEECVKILKSMVEELTDIFEDKFHLEMVIDSVDYFSIYSFMLFIHYPKLTIINEDGQSIKLTNHFQRVVIHIGTHYCSINHEMSCITVNPTAQQFVRGYNHSHTSSRSYYNNDFKRFCLGSNTEFVKLLGQFTNNPYDADIFHMFCINLITMAETESLAGKPHIRLATVAISGDLSSDRITHYLIEGYMNKYKYSYALKAVDWKVTSGALEVIDNEKLEQHCLIFEHNVDEYHNIGGIIVCKDSVGNYYRYTDDNNTSEYDIESIDWHVQFKDKQYKFGLADGAILKPETFFIHPQIKKHVKKHLEEKANIKLIKESITSKA